MVLLDVSFYLKFFLGEINSETFQLGKQNSNFIVVDSNGCGSSMGFQIIITMKFRFEFSRI